MTLCYNEAAGGGARSWYLRQHEAAARTLETTMHVKVNPKVTPQGFIDQHWVYSHLTIDDQGRIVAKRPFWSTPDGSHRFNPGDPIPHRIVDNSPTLAIRETRLNPIAVACIIHWGSAPRVCPTRTLDGRFDYRPENLPVSLVNGFPVRNVPVRHVYGRNTGQLPDDIAP